jgi:hypothetical protein
LNRKERPITSGWGGRKFFLPRIMKEPVGRYSPLGAVLDTCSQQNNLTLVEASMIRY